MIKFVFFDFDGVLTLQGHACNEICRYLEPVAKISAEKIEPVFHNMAKQLLINGKRYQDYIDGINNELNTHLTSEDILDAVKKSKINSEMIVLLEDLRKNHVQVGILTDNNIERLEMIRQHPKFGTLSPIVGSSEVGCTKNKCDKIFHEALKQANVIPSEVILIDDKKECLEIPHKMGFNSYHHDASQNNVNALRKYLHNKNLI